MSGVGETWMWAALVLVGFGFGSIPFGLFIARARGVDIRAHGSGNIGATNVWRVLGRGPGLWCFVLDAGKGLVPTVAAGLMLGVAGDGSLTNAQSGWWLGVGVAAVVGHMFSPWAGFRGGKGVATGLGALLGIFPYLTVPTLAAVGVWMVVVKIWRLVGVASCVAAASIPLWLWVWSHALQVREGLGSFYVGTGVLALLVVLRHRGNLARTIAGVEPRIGEPLDRPPAEAHAGGADSDKHG